MEAEEVSYAEKGAVPMDEYVLIRRRLEIRLLAENADGEYAFLLPESMPFFYRRVRVSLSGEYASLIPLSLSEVLKVNQLRRFQRVSYTIEYMGRSHANQVCHRFLSTSTACSAFS